MSERKYPAIEKVMRMYRGEDETPADSVTCPGCGLAFSPGTKPEAASPAAATAKPASRSEQLNAAERKRREAEEQAAKDRADEIKKLDREARKHAHAKPPSTMSELAASYYGAVATGDGGIQTSQRGGR